MHRWIPWQREWLEPPTLYFDRGTLILHPPPRGKDWLDYATWDDRIERFRIPASDYRRVVELLQAAGTPLMDKAANFAALDLTPSLTMPPYPHQQEALRVWEQAGGRGVVVLPTGGGQNLSGPTGDGSNRAQYFSDGADAGFNASVVCPSAGGLPGCGHWVAGGVVPAIALRS